MIERAEVVVEIVLTSGAIIALDTAEVAAATPRILDRYRVIRDRSPGL